MGGWVRAVWLWPARFWPPAPGLDPTTRLVHPAALEPSSRFIYVSKGRSLDLYRGLSRISGCSTQGTFVPSQQTSTGFHTTQTANAFLRFPSLQCTCYDFGMVLTGSQEQVLQELHQQSDAKGAQHYLPGFATLHAAHLTQS